MEYAVVFQLIASFAKKFFKYIIHDFISKKINIKFDEKRNSFGPQLAVIKS